MGPRRTKQPEAASPADHHHAIRFTRCHHCAKAVIITNTLRTTSVDNVAVTITSQNSSDTSRVASGVARSPKRGIEKLTDFLKTSRRKLAAHDKTVHAPTTSTTTDDTLNHIKLLADFLAAATDGPLNVPVVKSVAQLAAKIVTLVQVSMHEPSVHFRYSDLSLVMSYKPRRLSRSHRQDWRDPSIGHG